MHHFALGMTTPLRREKGDADYEGQQWEQALWQATIADLTRVFARELLPSPTSPS